jgi:hypothetical protein
MAFSKLKTLAKGCTLSFLAKDITSDRKHIRFFLTNSSKQHAMLGCEESITNKLRNKEITISQLLECRYNPKTNMIQ